jgi:hypothetical protein
LVDLVASASARVRRDMHMDLVNRVVMDLDPHATIHLLNGV